MSRCLMFLIFLLLALKSFDESSLTAVGIYRPRIGMRSKHLHCSTGPPFFCKLHISSHYWCSGGKGLSQLSLRLEVGSLDNCAHTETPPPVWRRHCYTGRRVLLVLGRICQRPHQLISKYDVSRTTSIIMMLASLSIREAA